MCFLIIMAPRVILLLMIFYLAASMGGWVLFVGRLLLLQVELYHNSPGKLPKFRGQPSSLTAITAEEDVQILKRSQNHIWKEIFSFFFFFFFWWLLVRRHVLHLLNWSKLKKKCYQSPPKSWHVFEVEPTNCSHQSQLQSWRHTKTTRSSSRYGSVTDGIIQDVLKLSRHRTIYFP